MRIYINSKIIALKIILVITLLIISCLTIVGCSSNNETSVIDKNNLPVEKENNNVNVTFVGEHIKCDAPDNIKKGSELNLNLDIEYDRDPNDDWKNVPDPQNTPSLYPEGELTKPITEYEVNIEDIHVYIGGKEYRDSFTWMYQTNNKNTLTIKKEYVLNDIKVEVNAKPRSSTLTLYGMELDNDIMDLYKSGVIKMTFKTPYQNSGLQLIRTLSNGEAFPMFEDDDIDVTISTTDPNGLPKNLVFRNCSRDTQLGLDFFREYSDDYKTCHIYVPHYVVRDHGSIRNKEL